MKLAPALAALLAGSTANAESPAKPKPPHLACKAMVDAKVIARANGPNTSDCAFALRSDVAKHFCKAGSKGKTFKFTVVFEHKLGARPWPDKQDSFLCTKEQP
jgi:hypothetical protein